MRGIPAISGFRSVDWAYTHYTRSEISRAAIISQRLYYGAAMPVVVVEEDDLEEALALADAEE